MYKRQAYGFVFWLFYCFMVTGARTKMRHSKEVFQYYCGKYLGWAYEIMAIAMLFLVTVTMVSSVGSIVSQYFGVNEIVGRLVMVVLVMASVLLGLRKLLDVLGPLGPVIVVGLIIIAVVAIASNPGGLATAPEFIENADPPILKASGFWLLSGILYGIIDVYKRQRLPFAFLLEPTRVERRSFFSTLPARSAPSDSPDASSGAGARASCAAGGSSAFASDGSGAATVAASDPSASSGTVPFDAASAAGALSSASSTVTELPSFVMTMPSNSSSSFFSWFVP